MFESLYQYFKSRKLILAIIVISIFGIALYQSFKIKSVEDISEMIPFDEELERFHFASKHIKMNDKIIVRIFLKDTTKISPETLIEFSDTLASLISNNYSGHIDLIQNTTVQKAINEVYEIFNNNLPVFLDETDYYQIENLLNENELRKSLEADFKTLISPTSLITKKFVKQDPLNITPLALKKLNNLQFDDNYEIYDNHILTKDKKSLLIFITSKYSNDQTALNSQLINGIKHSVKETENRNPFAGAELYGAPVISAGNAERIKKDVTLTVSVAIIALFLFISFFYKRFYVFFLIFLPVVFGAVFSIAFLKVFQGEVSSISLGIGLILASISIDYSLHVFTHFRAKKNALKIFRDITMPLLLSSFSTSSAFFCLLFVSSDALNDLGVFAGISITVSTLFVLIVLPHFLKKKPDNSQNTEKLNLPEKIASYHFHKNKYLIAATLIISIFSFIFAGKAEFENDMDKMNYMSDELKDAEKNLNKSGNDALRKMYFVVTGDNLEKALIKNDLLSEKIKYLKEKGIIKNYVSVNYFLVSDSLQKLRIKQSEKFWNKERIAKLETNLKLYGKEYGFKEDAFSNFINQLKNQQNILTEDEKQKLIEIFAKDLISFNKNFIGIVSLVKFESDSKPMVYKYIKEDENTYIVDKKFVTEKVVMILKKDFNKLAIISMAVVILIILLYFGRIELTIITMLPMVISWFWTLSLMWLTDIKFTIFNIIITTFIFGLGNDYSIFISRGLLQKYRFGINNLPSYKTSVLLSAITTVTGIGVLILAQHPAMRSIALLSVFGIISVIFITYTLQPLLFNFLIEQQGKKRSLPITFKDLFFAIIVFIYFVLGSLLSGVFRLILVFLPFRKKYKKYLFKYWLYVNSKIIVYIPVNIKKLINNPFQERFEKPGIIISNHQSHIDIPLILMLHPKLLILTNDWVQNNLFYGKIVKYADYYPTSDGFDKNLIKLRERVKEGYSVLIFPEGSRSDNFEIKRFHKGAFEYAKALGIDIIPVIIQGAGDCIPKGEPFLKSGQITINITERISVDNYGKTSREQSKNIRKLMQTEYLRIREKYETPAYFRKKLIANYIYKTPVIEHYTRIKTKIENNYSFFCNLLPKSGHITDIGTGYGYLPYMLSFTQKALTITGIDYDCDKINTANHNISKNDRLQFICEDVTTSELPESEAFIINDVLHYMPQDAQKKLIIKCIEKLNPGGQIIIRDGNTEMLKKHRGTKLSEFFSTKLLKFNKTAYDKLHFTSKSEILEIIKPYHLSVEIIDETKYTSNIVFVLKKS